MQEIIPHRAQKQRDSFGYLLPYQDADLSTIQTSRASSKQQQNCSPLRSLSFEELCTLPEQAGVSMNGMDDELSWESLSSHPNFPQLIAIVGPTASGKTALADELAWRLSCSVLSLDSMQVYRGMDIGTAKAQQDELKAPLVGIDLVDASSSYSVQEFQNFARSFIDQELAHNRGVVLCGGTGLYFNAVLDSYDFPAGKQTENPVRNKYQSYLNQYGSDALWKLLASQDEASARCIHPNNTKRVVRALEMLDEGVHYHEQTKNLRAHNMRYSCACIGCAVERDLLYERINQRVDHMFKRGLLEEFSRLKAEGVFSSLTASQAIGYRELLEENDIAEAQERIKQNSRRYAKRQLTWFYKDPRIQWISTQNRTLDEQLLDVYHYLNYLSETKEG